MAVSRARLIMSFLLAFSFLPSHLPAATKADPSEFYRRLESIGLKTDQLKKVASKISLWYWEPNAAAEASYGYIRNRLYIPYEFKEEKSNKIRFDLEPHQICTVIHEFTHAELDVTASEKAPRGTPDHEHWQAVEWIWADISLDPRHHFMGLARYPRFKADEVAGYYMGDAANRLFDAANDIILYNTVFFDKAPGMQDPDAIERLGEKLILPEAGDPGWGQNLLKVKFGQKFNSFEAYFENKKIEWDMQAHVVAHLYKYALGLEPPKDLAELLDRMNGGNNPWLKEVRAKVVAARKKQIAKLRAKPSARSADPLDAQSELNGR